MKCNITRQFILYIAGVMWKPQVFLVKLRDLLLWNFKSLRLNQKHWCLSSIKSFSSYNNMRNIRYQVHEDIYINLLFQSVMQCVFFCSSSCSYRSSLLPDYSHPAAAVGLQQHRIVRDYTLAVRLPVWRICSQLRTALHKLQAIMKLFKCSSLYSARCCHRVSALYFTAI